jgi:adenylylsulfate kinase
MMGFAIWLTGLPGSGKSTLARKVAERLRADGIYLQILDSDELRKVLTPQPTYSKEERDWFYEVMARIGQLLTQNNVNVAFAATAARRRYRDRARQTIDRFAEVFVKCSLESCIGRDPKGLYAKARAGEVTNLPGLQAPYEAPEMPEVVVDTETLTAEQGARTIVERLSELAFLD